MSERDRPEVKGFEKASRNWSSLREVARQWRLAAESELARRRDAPTAEKIRFAPCGCSLLKVRAGLCDAYHPKDADAIERGERPRGKT